MANLIPIQMLSRAKVEAVVRRALRDGLDVDLLADFLSSVDWSGTDQTRPPVADLLGKLEGWTHDFFEAAIDQSTLVENLSGVLRTPARAE